MLGAPYRYGGDSPQGFDCSGLVLYSYRQANIKVPRTSLSQYQQSQAVSAHRLRPGDLVFFHIRGKKRGVTHVGIYQGNNRFIHAPSSGGEVTVARLDEPYWRNRLVGGGRFY